MEERGEPYWPMADMVATIAYAHGSSSLGDFLVAANAKGLCAVFFGEYQAELLSELSDANPGTAVQVAEPVLHHFLIGIMAGVIERPAALAIVPTCPELSPLQLQVRAILASTTPGTTVTPEEVAGKVPGRSPGAESVRELAAADRLAVIAPFHRLQERDGSSPAYRWGEARRRTLLARETAVEVWRARTICGDG